MINMRPVFEQHPYKVFAYPFPCDKKTAFMIDVVTQDTESGQNFNQYEGWFTSQEAAEEYHDILTNKMNCRVCPVDYPAESSWECFKKIYPNNNPDQEYIFMLFAPIAENMVENVFGELVIKRSKH